MILVQDRAALVLLVAADDDLTVALAHIEARNFGLAADWIEAARRKLPKDTEQQGITPWPERRHFEQDTRFEYRPEYASVRSPHVCYDDCPENCDR